LWCDGLRSLHPDEFPQYGSRERKVKTRTRRCWSLPGIGTVSWVHWVRWSSAPNQGAAVELIFGTTDGSEKGLLAAGGQAGEALREIFPIPGLCYGPNYV
jgi:hypothetical protein